MKFYKLARCLIIAFLSTTVAAEEMNVAVASNFAAPMREIVALFEAETGHEVQLSFGSSGRFFAQISNGAPFVAFFSADQDKPLALEEAGLIVAGSRFTYAQGSLALWSRDASVEVQEGEVLREGNFSKLALANPALAPYGRAAVEVLAALGLEESTKPKLVRGENIAQAYQFVYTRNAQVGFVALSQIIDPETGGVSDGAAWIVPDALYDPIRQDAVLLPGAGSTAAAELLAFMRSPAAKNIIRAYGYSTAGE